MNRTCQDRQSISHFAKYRVFYTLLLNIQDHLTLYYNFAFENAFASEQRDLQCIFQLDPGAFPLRCHCRDILSHRQVHCRSARPSS